MIPSLICTREIIIQVSKVTNGNEPLGTGKIYYTATDTWTAWILCVTRVWRFVLTHHPGRVLSFNATVKTVSACYSCTTSRTFSLPSSLIFDFFPLLIQGVCLSCGVSGISERIMTAIVPGESPRELPRTWVSLGWLTACQLLWPNETAWGTQISRQTTHLHRYELRLHCLSCFRHLLGCLEITASQTETLGHSLNLSHTYKTIR